MTDKTNKMKEMEIIKNCETCGVDLRYLLTPIHRWGVNWYCNDCWDQYKTRRR